MADTNTRVTITAKTAGMAQAAKEAIGLNKNLEGLGKSSKKAGSAMAGQVKVLREQLKIMSKETKQASKEMDAMSKVIGKQSEAIKHLSKANDDLARSSKAVGRAMAADEAADRRRPLHASAVRVDERRQRGVWRRDPFGDVGHAVWCWVSGLATSAASAAAEGRRRRRSTRRPWGWKFPAGVPPGCAPRGVHPARAGHVQAGGWRACRPWRARRGGGGRNPVYWRPAGL